MLDIRCKWMTYSKYKNEERNRKVNKIASKPMFFVLEVEYCTVQREPQFVPLPPVTIRIRHHLEYANPTIDMFNQYLLRCRTAIRKLHCRRDKGVTEKQSNAAKACSVLKYHWFTRNDDGMKRWRRGVRFV